MASISAREAGTEPPLRQSSVLVIAASSLGTVFEWYDFYLYGLLASIITSQFFSGVNETTGFIFALAAFAAGFAVRPFGALVFGRIGDLVGRKNTFLVTMGLMGRRHSWSACCRATPRSASPRRSLLVALRLLQGLALGGRIWRRGDLCRRARARTGSAGSTPASSRPPRRSGLFAALLVVIGMRTAIGEEAFAAWGWRLPFLISAILLLAVSLWIRLQLQESPVFQQMKEEGDDLQGAADRGVRPLAEPEAGADRAARRGRRAGGGLVHRPVLRAVLPREDPQGRRRRPPTS